MMISRLQSHFADVNKTDEGDSIIIVSGLPRSGTSMMMKMLAAAKLEMFTDNLRVADEDNPEGYFEFERVKKLKNGDFEWLPQAKGKAVKVISALLEFLPPQFKYRVVFMQRRMSEILASQRKMLANRGKADGSVDDETMAELYRKHLDTVKRWLSRQPNFRVLEVEYNRLLTEPAEDLMRLSQFLNRPVDLEQMRAVIDNRLYRQRF
jgi:sulfotransferase family protein